MASRGRPKGSVTTFQFRNYVTEDQRAGFVGWALKNYKKNPKLATWVGDQMFGKAVQPLGNDEGKPLIIAFDKAFTPDAPTPTPTQDSPE